MQCTEAFELLCGHLDHENTPQEEAALQAHLQTCASCRALLQQLTETDRELDTLRRPAPDALRQGVMDRIAAAPVQKPHRRRFPFTAVAAAAALILLIGTGAIKLPGMETKYNSSVSEDFSAADPEVAEAAASEGQAVDKAEAQFQDEASQWASDATQEAPPSPSEQAATSPAAGTDTYQAMADREGADVLVIRDVAAAQLPLFDALPYTTCSDGTRRYDLDQAQLRQLLEALDSSAVDRYPFTGGEPAANTIVLFPAS